MSLLSALESYRPTDLQERRYRDRTIQLLHVYSHKAFCRSLLTGHVTASAFLLNSDETKFLLLHHRKLDRWFQPGGHCDGERNVLAVALKEAQEESGLQRIEPVSRDFFDLDIHHIPELKGVPAHDHYDIRFLLKAVGDDTLVQNAESKELRWFSFDEPLPTEEESVLRMVRKCKSYLALASEVPATAQVSC